MGNVIELENGLKFIIVATQILDEEKYLYLTSLDDSENNIFVRLNDDKTIEPIEDGELLVKLTSLLVKQAKEKLENK